MRRSLTVFVLALLTVSAFAGKMNQQNDTRAANAEGVIQTFSEQVSGHFDVEAYNAEQAAIHGLLTSRASHGATGLQFQPTQAQLDEIGRFNNCEDCSNGMRKLMVGFNMASEESVNIQGSKFGERATEVSGGVLAPNRDGGYSWTTTVSSAGASAIRLHLSGFSLPQGAQLFVYNEAGWVDGPYQGQGPNGNGDVWTGGVPGETVSVQILFDGSVDGITSFNIQEVAHIGDEWVLPSLVEGVATEAFCSNNASCVEDASCHTQSATNGARNGVAHILYSSGGSQYICSGGLLNDTDNSTQRYWFLTANHCISTSSEANSASFYWQYKTSSCGGACFSPYTGSVPSTSGSSLVVTGSSSDFTLLECSQAPPGGSTLLGWSNSAVANSNGVNLYRISHPKGSPQAYSHHQVSTTKGTCGSWPRGAWIYEQDITGATEGGSSGSPVLNSSGQVVGQLSGACGTNPQNPCASSQNATVDGALAAYWNSVAPYLDPGSGPTCLPSGSNCNNNSDCCSGSCSGWFTTTCN